MELRMYLEILRRRRLLIVAATVIVASVAGVTSSLKTPVYTATARVLLRPGDPSEEFNPDRVNRPYADPNRYLAGQLDIIESHNVAVAAANELHVKDPGALLSQLSAHQAGTTDIVAIAFTDPDPVRASQGANAFAHAYIEDRRANSVAGLERASREVDAKLADVQRQLADLDKQIALQTPTTTTTATTTSTTTTTTTATSTTTSTTTTSTTRPAVPQPAPTTTTTAAPPATTTTQPQASTAQATTTTTRPATTTTTQPATTTTTAEPSTTSTTKPKRSATTTTTKPATTTTTPRSAQAAGGGPQGSLPLVLISATGPAAPVRGQVASDNPDALRATRDAAALQYQSLYSRQQELLISASLKRGEAELIAAAGIPTAPSSPNPERDLALGTVVGLMLGLGFAFLREQLDDRLRSREEAEEATGLPILAELPLDADAARYPTQLAAHERPSGALAESARSLRTSLSFLGVDEPLRCVLVTSPGQGDGKSFVAANLAAVYAQAGLRTVLVSADLRRPRLESLFPEVPAGPGLTEVIAGLAAEAPSANGHGGTAPGDTALARALRPTHVDGLLFLQTGKLPPNPAELLGSRRAAAVLEALAEAADVTVIDSPPILAVTDAAVLAPKVDGIILVAAPGRTARGALARTAATLSKSGVRLVGVVLNQVEGKGHSYSYSYYYSSHYSSEAHHDHQASPSPRRSRRSWRRGGGEATGSETEAGVRSE